MPALPSPGQVVKMIFRYGLEDAVAENIRYFNYGGPGPVDLATLTSFANSSVMTTDFNAPYIGAAPVPEMGIDTSFIDLSSPLGITYERLNAWVGTNTGTVLSANNAVCVSDQIARRYRGGHPRSYMMVGTSGDFATGSVKDWQAAFLANIQAGFDTWMSAFPFIVGAYVFRPVNVSYYETVGGVKTVRPTPLVDDIFAVTVRERVCSQRRRLGRANA